MLFVFKNTLELSHTHVYRLNLIKCHRGHGLWCPLWLASIINAPSPKQWRSQDLILGGGGKNNVRGSGASEGGGGRVWEGGHSESFLHFDVVNGAIWCICPVFSSYSTNLYLILLWKWLKGGSFTCIHATLFSFFSLSPFIFIFGIFWGATAPTLATRLLQNHCLAMEIVGAFLAFNTPECDKRVCPRPREKLPCLKNYKI